MSVGNNVRLENDAEARAWLVGRWGGKVYERLGKFCDLLTSEAQNQNLIARSTLSSLWLRHIADSAQLLLHVPDRSRSWFDLGSGAGFPGLIIALIDADREVILIENRRLRISWLNTVINELEVTNCTVVGCTVQSAAPARADVISARAFADLEQTLNLGSRFSTPVTRWLLPKGRSAAHEVASLPRQLRSMFHVEQSITDADAGIVVGVGQMGAVM